ncbi:MAG: SpoIIE family protein phosphatase [Flavobacteriales bacterium]|nr:SpoIIE family protein phosphatase [Flavobacteriales bacterium]
MARLERIAERLELKEFQLKALLDVTKAINANTPREELLRLYEKIVREDLGITRLLLFERTDRWQQVLGFGHPDGTTFDAEQAFGRFTDIQVIGSEAAGSLGAFDVAVPVYHQDRPLAFLLIGDIDEEEQRMSPTVKHLNFIQTLTNLIVVAMENRRLAQEALQRARDLRDLELARQMQRMLVPATLPDNAQIAVDAWYQPHSQVGGDHYDLIALADGTYVACVADVSGKGMAAALLTSNFQANLHAAVRHATDLVDLVHDLNTKVWSNARGERFITCFIGHIDLGTRRIRYVNAGHNDPLLHSSAGITPLHTGSIALGMMPKLPFLQVGEADIPEGSTLLCYTDGLVEQEDAHGNDFGTERLHHLLRDLHAATPKDINEALQGAYEAHRAGQPYLDDIAVLTCRLK